MLLPVYDRALGSVAEIPVGNTAGAPRTAVRGRFSTVIVSHLREKDIQLIKCFVLLSSLPGRALPKHITEQFPGPNSA